MSQWVQLLKAVVLAILNWLVHRAKPAAGDGSPPGPLEDRLKKKIKKDGW